MDLERVAAVIRPRSHWEAVDLGYAMVRTWWRSILPAWIACLLPRWLVALSLGRGAPAWALLFLWWIKPLADRLPLFVASRALFGAPPTLRRTFAAAPALFARGALAALTIERLDPARSFRLPVRQLEGLSGTERKARSAVLARDGRDPAALLTFACLAMEILLFFALWALAGLLLPEAVEARWDEHLAAYLEGEAPLWFHLGLGLGWLAAFTLVEPFYAVAGFALYLNRRTLLEGWDVEIAFRRLARRLLAGEAEAAREEASRPPRRITAAAILLAAACGVGAVGPAGAVEAASEDAKAQRRIEEVLAQPEFETMRKVRRLAWEGPEATSERGPAFSLPAELLGMLFEAALWVGAAVLLAAILLHLPRHGGGGRERGLGRRRAPPPAAVLFGLEVKPEALPADVPGAALRCLEQGRPVEALSLLFRGALAFLVHRRGVEVRPSWTEGECLRYLAGRLEEPGGLYLGRLTRAWQAAAYAHRLPEAEELRDLCRLWPSHFEAAA